MQQAAFLCSCATFVIGLIFVLVGNFALQKFQEGTCMVKKAGSAPPPYVCERRCTWLGLKCEDYARFDGVTIWLADGTQPSCDGFYGESGGCQSSGSSMAQTAGVECLLGDDGTCGVEEAGIPEQEITLQRVVIWFGAILATCGICGAIGVFAILGLPVQQAYAPRVLNNPSAGYKRAPLRVDHHTRPLAPEEGADDHNWNPWLACARACQRQPPPDSHVRPIGYDKPGQGGHQHGSNHHASMMGGGHQHGSNHHASMMGGGLGGLGSMMGLRGGPDDRPPEPMPGSGRGHSSSQAHHYGYGGGGHYSGGEHY